VQTALSQKPVSFWYEKLSAAGVPCSPIYSMRQLLDHPHTSTTGMVLDYDHPHGGPMKAVAQPFVLDETDRMAGLPPPLLGQHTDDILKEAGFSKIEVEKLRASKAIA
jgi:crotonobetainyl-CoA:carnitine CoA-transferase CaiB-like acyl-CoA transferase